jgi:acetyl-CoA carboxylase carboxyltransferase component
VVVRERVPILGIWHSGGARLAEGVESLHPVGRVFATMTKASCRRSPWSSAWSSAPRSARR